MATKGKAKEVAGKAPSTSSAKRKKPASESTDRRNKRRAGVLQFFDDVADDSDYDDEDDEEDEDLLFDDEDIDLDVSNKGKGKGESSYKGGGRSYHLPFFVKEEELSGDELEELIKDRYGKKSDNVVHGEDPKEFDDDVVVEHTKEDPNIWKVKCMAGREQQIVFCLMHKYADMQRLGTKMDIISAFSLEHVKGYVYIEADKACDVSEACKGFFNIYSTKIGQIPRNDIPKLLSIRNKTCVISKGTWVRMKNGNYKGDLGQVVDFDEAWKRAMIKLVPRIDLQAIAKKYGGGISLKEAAVPPPRLISSSELEHFRPHIEIKRDRDTGETFDVLDGMMLKDGYLYKKVSMASIVFWGVQPSKDELLKFTEMRKDEEEDVSWLSSVYSVRKKMKSSQASDGKTSQASEQDDSAKQGSGFNVHDLVLFGRKAFGVIIDMGKDGIKVLKGGTEGQEVLTVKIQDIKNRCIDKMFTACDRHAKTIFINDTVKVSDGPLEGKQGTVRHMYRGTLFIYDESQEENSGIFSAKSNMCENTTPSKDFLRKGGNKASSLLSQSPVRDEQEDNPRTFSRNRQSENQVFSIGQSLRIRKGPLKGYLCRVVAIYRSDVTVKLDSLGKVLTVEEQLLSIPTVKRDFSGNLPSDPFGTQAIGNHSNGGEPAIGTSSWEIGSSSWQPLSTSSFSFATNNAEKADQNQGADPWGNKVALPTKDHEQVADPWGSKVSLCAGDQGDADLWGSKSASVATDGQQNSAWGNNVGGGLDKDGDVWNKPSGAPSSVQGGADPWGSKLIPGVIVEKEQGSDLWGSKVARASKVEEQKADPWGPKVSGASNVEEQNADPWGTKVAGSSKAGAWGAEMAGQSKAVEEQNADPWGTKVTWSKAVEKQKTDPWGAKVGSPSKAGGEGADPWGTKVAGASRGNEQQKSDPGAAKVAGSSGDERKSDPWGTKVAVRDSIQSDEALDSWAKTSNTTVEQNSSWNNRPAGGDLEKDNWGAAMSSTKSALEHGSSWDKVKSASDGSSGLDAGWGKPGTSTKNDTDGWNSSKSFGGDQGSDWKKADGVDTNKSFQWNSWDSKPNNVQGGRGFGGGRGRGGNSWDNKPMEDGVHGSSSGEGGWNGNNDGAGGNVGQKNSWSRQKDFDGGGKCFGRGRGRGRFGGRGGQDEEESLRSLGEYNSGGGGGWGSGRGRGRGRFGGRGGQDEDDSEHGSGDYNTGGGWGYGSGRGRGRFGGRGGQDEEDNQHGSGDYNSGGGWGSGRGRGSGWGGRGRGGRFQSYNGGSDQDNNLGSGSFSLDPVSSSWGNGQNISTWDASKSFSLKESAVVQQQDSWAGWNSSSREAGSSKQSSDWGKDDGNDKWNRLQKNVGDNQSSDWNQVKSGNNNVSKEGGCGMGDGWDNAKQSDDTGAGGDWGKFKSNYDGKQASAWSNTEKGGWGKSNSHGGGTSCANWIPGSSAADGDKWSKSTPCVGDTGNWDKEKSFGGGKGSDWNQNSHASQAGENAGGSDDKWSKPKSDSGRDRSSGWGTGDGGNWIKPKPSGGESSSWNNKNDWNGNSGGKPNSFSGDNPSSVWGRNGGTGDQLGGWNSGSYSERGNSFSDRGRGRGRGGRNFSYQGRGRNFSDKGGRSSGWNGGRGTDNNSEIFSRSGNDGGWGSGSTSSSAQKQEESSGWSNSAPVAGGDGWNGWEKPGGSQGNAATGGKGGWE